MISDQDKISNNINKINFFLRENIIVHVELLSGTFYNGKILKKVEDGVYIIDDRVLGEQHLFISEVHRIETFREQKDKPTFNNF